MIDIKKILLIGWDPSAVDYNKWPDLNPEKLRVFLEADSSNLNSLGYEATWCFIADAKSASDKVTQALSDTAYDCILIGAGVRLDPDAFMVFERLINVVHISAPNARLCFNTNPSDAAEAIKRWL